MTIIVYRGINLKNLAFERDRCIKRDSFRRSRLSRFVRRDLISSEGCWRIGKRSVIESSRSIDDRRSLSSSFSFNKKLEIILK